MLEAGKPNILEAARDTRGMPSRESGLREFLEKYYALSAREIAIRNQQLYSIEIELTKKCNLACSYCYSNSSRFAREQLDPDIVRRILREGYEYGLRSVAWLGGEPLLYGHLFEMLQYAKELGYEESVLYTNATMITRAVAHKLRPWVDTVAVHLDTLSPEVFAKVHFDIAPSLAKHSHTLILDGVKNLLVGGFAPDNIRLTLTPSRPTLEKLPSLFQWAFSEMGFQTSVFLPVIPFGRAKDLPSQWFLTYHQVEQAYRLRAEAERRPYLLEIGCSEYCKQYQMSMCYIRADGALAAYAGGAPVAAILSSKPFAALVGDNYGQLAFRAYSDGVRNTPVSGDCWNCTRQRYCFGTPICAKTIGRCPFREAPQTMLQGSEAQNSDSFSFGEVSG